MATHDEFDYDTVAFRDPKKQIRLLCCQPQEKSDEPIKCRVEVFDLDNTPKHFIALSYVWGQPKGTIPILCNDIKHQLLVTPSLHDVLIRFAYDQAKNGNQLDAVDSWPIPDTKIDDIPEDMSIRTALVDSSTWLWVDQVCINQKDKLEKSRQIPLIERIYEHAPITILWMGVETTEGKTTLRVARDLFEASQKYRAAGETRKIYAMEQKDREGFDLLNLTQGECEKVAAFLCKGWFSQLWVRQELATSQLPLLTFHRKFISWERFDEALTFADSHSIPIYPIGGPDAFGALSWLRQATQKNQRNSLLALLSVAQALDY